MENAWNEKILKEIFDLFCADWYQEEFLAQIKYLISEELEKGSFVEDTAKDFEEEINKPSSGEDKIVKTMEETQRLQSYKKKIFQCLITIFVWKAISGNIHYVIREETPIGFFVGNIAMDLGIDGNNLSEYGLRIATRTGMVQYFALNYNNGYLQTSERIDREKICGWAENCVLNFEIIIESKIEIYRVEVKITDINDNAPQFIPGKHEIKISELSTPGSQFPLPEAQDPDLGINSIQRYELTSNSHFSLDMQIKANGARQGELVLKKHLDREQQSTYDLIFTASDGGEPVKSGSARIQVIVLDANDNAPIFSQSIYEVSIEENILKGFTILTVRAIDLDEGLYGEINYSFKKITKEDSKIFTLNSTSGIITIMGNLDYEESSLHEFEVKAEDGGGLCDWAKVLVTVMDLNDNAPQVTISFFINSISENSPKGAVIALLNVQDDDSGINGEVTCSLTNNFPFQFKKSLNNFYRLVTCNDLDRELISDYKISITATDHGNPPLTTVTEIFLQILDTNDNPPEFLESKYTSYLLENNPKGASAFSLKASYLVTKVVAVDADSGQNAWLSYQLIRATEPGLFTVGLHTGEIRTARLFLEKDALKQILVVLVKDNGQPPLSASVTLTVVLADNIPEILSDLSNISAPVDPQSDLTFYLVTAVAFVSCLFFTFLLVLLAIRVYRWRNSKLLDSRSVHFSGVPVSQFVGMDGVRAFLQSYCHTISLTRDSRKSHCNFHEENCSNTLTNQPLTCGVSDPILAYGDLNSKNDEQILVKLDISSENFLN
ncbi:hypothetical protein Chor_003258 [Crotalus horridus]